MAPTVFISYAHDSAGHKAQVLEFATFLRAQGIEAVLDVWSTESRRDWYPWVVRQLTGADYVAVVASQKFRQAGDGLGPDSEHRGIQSEAALLRELLCGERATWLRKILPVVLPGHGIDEIPLFLQPHTASRYVLESLTPEGAAELLRVIRGEPYLVPPVVASAAVEPTDVVPARPVVRTEHLLGRQDELALLAGLVDDVISGNGKAIIVDGEPGIGKSTLVGAACAVAAGRGCSVFWGAGDELGQALPLLPLLDALRVAAGSARGEAIARLLRGEVALGGADPVAAASEQLVALVGELCAAAPVVLVVDDVQWADRTTLAVWARLAKSARNQRLLLVGMTRRQPRSVELRALRRAAEGRVLTLGPLAAPAVEGFLVAAAGGRPGADLLRLAGGAAGNPLFLTELVDALRRGHALWLTEAGVVELAGDFVLGSLVAAIESRLEFATGRLGDMLRVAALLGVDFSPSELAVVLGVRMLELVRDLDDAIDAGVLRPAGANIAFRHPLIRQVLYEGVAPATRATRHLVAARALAESGAPVHRVARQLVHVVRDARLEGLDEWLRQWLVSASPSLVAQAPRLAVELLGAAVPDPAAAETGARTLAVRLAAALYRAGDAAEAERVAVTAATVVTEPDLMIDLQWTLSECRALTGRSAESLAALERTLETPGIDPAHHARLLVLTARSQCNLGKVAAAVRVAGEALEEAEAVGDGWAIGWALHVLIIGAVMRGEVSAALPLFERALEVTEGDVSLGDLRMLTQIDYANALGDVDQHERAIACAREVRESAEQLGSRIRLAQAHSALGELLFETGRWDEVLAEVACCAHGVAAVIGFHRGDTALASRNLTAAHRAGERVAGSLALARSLERECSGAPREALEVLLAHLIPQVEELEDLLPDAVRLAVDVGELDTAAELVGGAEALAARSAVPHRSAAACYCRGLLDRDADRLLLAARHFAEAGRPLPRAMALEAAAVTLADGEALTAAYEVYDSLGANRDTARIAAISRRHGIPRLSPAPMPAPMPLGDTPYEFLRQQVQDPPA